MVDIIVAIFSWVFEVVFQNAFRRKNFVEILIGAISGFVTAGIFSAWIQTQFGLLDFYTLVFFEILGAIGGVFGSAIGTGIRLGKLSAMISGAIGCLILCGLMFILIIIPK